MNKDYEQRQHDGTMHESQTTQIPLDSQAQIWSNDEHYNVNVLVIVPGEHEQVNRVWEQLNEILISTNANKQLIVGEQPNGRKENEISFFETWPHTANWESLTTNPTILEWAKGVRLELLHRLCVIKFNSFSLARSLTPLCLLLKP